MLEVLGPSALLILISLPGDLIHPPMVSYHTYSQMTQFLSPVLILPLNSRLIYLFIVCLPSFEYLKRTSCSSSLRLDLMICFRPGPDPGSLSVNGTTVYPVAQVEVKELLSPLTLILISKSYWFHHSNCLSIHLLLSISIVIILVQFTIISHFSNDNISSVWSTCTLTSLLTYILSSTLQLEWLFPPLQNINQLMSSVCLDSFNDFSFSVGQNQKSILCTTWCWIMQGSVSQSVVSECISNTQVCVSKCKVLAPPQI